MLFLFRIPDRPGHKRRPDAGGGRRHRRTLRPGKTRVVGKRCICLLRADLAWPVAWFSSVSLFLYESACHCCCCDADRFFARCMDRIVVPLESCLGVADGRTRGKDLNCHAPGKYLVERSTAPQDFSASWWWCASCATCMLCQTIRKTSTEWSLMAKRGLQLHQRLLLWARFVDEPPSLGQAKLEPKPTERVRCGGKKIRGGGDRCWSPCMEAGGKRTVGYGSC